MLLAGGCRVSGGRVGCWDFVDAGYSLSCGLKIGVPDTAGELEAAAARADGAEGLAQARAATIEALEEDLLAAQKAGGSGSGAGSRIGAAAANGGPGEAAPCSWQ